MADATRTPPEGTTLEIWPGVPNTKPAVKFALADAYGNPLGALYMTSDLSNDADWKNAGWQPRAQYWVWTSGQWPAGDFVARNAADQDGTPETPPGVTVRHVHDFKQTGEFTTEQDGSKVPLYGVSTTGFGKGPQGFVKVAQLDDDSIKVWSTVSGALSIAANYQDDLYFTRIAGSQQFDAYGYRKDAVIDTGS